MIWKTYSIIPVLHKNLFFRRYPILLNAGFDPAIHSRGWEIWMCQWNSVATVAALLCAKRSEETSTTQLSTFFCIWAATTTSWLTAANQKKQENTYSGTGKKGKWLILLTLILSVQEQNKEHEQHECVSKTSLIFASKIEVSPSDISLSLSFFLLNSSPSGRDIVLSKQG